MPLLDTRRTTTFPNFSDGQPRTLSTSSDSARRLGAVARLLEAARAFALPERVVAPRARQQPEPDERVAVLVAHSHLRRGRAFERQLNPGHVVPDRAADAGRRVAVVVVPWPRRGRARRVPRLPLAALRAHHLVVLRRVGALARPGLVVGRRGDGVGARRALAE